MAPSRALIKVGFPDKRAEDAPPVMAFTPGGGMETALCQGAYQCPQCSAYHTELPTQCNVCQIKVRPCAPSARRQRALLLTGARSAPACAQLMSSVELTKTYHHLFPVPGFTEATMEVVPMPSAPTAAAAAAAAAAAVKADAPARGGGASVVQTIEDGPPGGRCFGCAERLPRAPIAAGGGSALEAFQSFRCPDCKRHFCAACDELVHAVLHVCLGCEVVKAKARSAPPGPGAAEPAPFERVDVSHEKRPRD